MPWWMWEFVDLFPLGWILDTLLIFIFFRYFHIGSFCLWTAPSQDQQLQGKDKKTLVWILSGWDEAQLIFIFCSSVILTDRYADGDEGS